LERQNGQDHGRVQEQLVVWALIALFAKRDTFADMEM
jgi:hypothetical protein